MKTLLSISLLILIFAVSKGQNTGDNAIIIKSRINMLDLKKILITEGYEFYQIDTVDGFFSTLPHPIEGSVYAYNLNIKILGVKQSSGLKLTANYTSQYSNGMGGMADASGRASFEKRKNVSKRLSFDELNRIALKISSDIIYLKE